MKPGGLMILSRTLARGRIARGERPGFLAAWGPVIFDALAFAGAAVLVWPLLRALLDGAPLAVTVLVLTGVYFLPGQAILIVSALWATKSRWQDRGSDA